MPLDSHGNLPVLRYAPDLQNAEVLLFSLPQIPSVQLSYELREPLELSASSDGQWLLLKAIHDKSGTLAFSLIARAANGAPCMLLQSEIKSAEQLLSSNWRAVEFVPNRHQILLYAQAALPFRPHETDEPTTAELGLFDTDSHDFRRIPLAGNEESFVFIDFVDLSPSGEFALVQFGIPGTTMIGKTVFHGYNLKYVVCNLQTGASRVVQEVRQGGSWQNLRWLGDDHLLSLDTDVPMVLNRDGTGARPLLK
jgi:hypothetical protein